MKIIQYDNTITYRNILSRGIVINCSIFKFILLNVTLKDNSTPD